MALVGYSDSEDSDIDAVQPVVPPDTSKKFDRTSARKIKVDLTALSAKPISETPEEPASKRQRTAGVFSGFNSLLPPPKRTVQSGVKRGVNLKTSSEAAFSREPVQRLDPHTDITPESNKDLSQVSDDLQNTATPPAEVKLIGKATRFVPLSVANARRKKPVLPSPASQPQSQDTPIQATSQPARIVEQTSKLITTAPKAKPKRSLFAIDHAESTAMVASAEESYEPEFSPSSGAVSEAQAQGHALALIDALPSDGAGLQNAAADLNLSASERRRLFGRNAARNDIKITHFNMDDEYRTNQEIAAKGELVEHRAVKAIAPGKHSLQQLVNNVRGQTDALEDKWAEGRRNRSEAGNKYGW